MQELEKELASCIKGDLRFDTISKVAYSVDASIYEIEPVGIVLPRTKQDLVNAIKIAVRHNVPVIARGAATGITGGCIGKGLIIDTSKYLNRILEINYDQEYAICEPGVVQDQLNHSLSSKGYRLGPDTSTGDRATLGGMMANNSAGARSLHYGKMVDHVLSVELALATGELLEFASVDTKDLEARLRQQDAEGHIYREVIRIRDHYWKDIEKHFPKIPRRVSGYNLDELIKPGPLNISKLITGSEGTLGIATKIKVGISRKPGSTALCVVHFSDMVSAMHTILEMLKFQPMALEMIDDQIILMGRRSPSMKSKLGWIQGEPQCVFVAEFEADTSENAGQKAVDFKNAMIQKQIGYAQVILNQPEAMSHVWEVRKAGLGLLLSRRTYSRAIAFIEDLSIGPEQLAPFMEKFCAYLKSKGKQAGIYGHVGPGCMHVRPYINLLEKSETELMHQMMLDISDLILEHGGALSGEHGDGLIRSWLNKKMFGDQVYQAFVELKSAFDPENRMNPGKIVHAPPLLENLRISPGTKIASIPTFLDFSPEGGFELAADLCNGNGLCRKKESVMCPSFQASGDEYDTTRARAQALRAVINGRLPLEKFTSPEIHDVLDLCLECKGCKTECPSQVDMAKMKAEFLYQYQEKHGYSLRSKLFGNIGRINQIGSNFTAIFNWLNSTFLAKKLTSWIGIAPQRSLPALASERFSTWVDKLTHKVENSRGQVVLFNDTFTEFNQPEIGKDAIKVLHKLGYDVVVPPWHCCGRPLISKGLLPQAKKKAEALVELLFPFADQGIQIIGLEPSCILTLKDDFSGLLGTKSSLAVKVNAITKACKTFDEFVAEHLQDGKLPFSIKQSDLQVKLHGHCHQKSLVGTQPTLQVLKAIPGFHVSEIDSGCCGMAGSFGYEKEHYEFSMKIGELRLFPAVRATAEDTIIVADGISCRSQIAQGTGRKAKHLAEVLGNLIS